MQEMWAPSLGLEDPLKKEMQPTPVFLPGKSHEQRSLVAYSPWDHKEADVTEHILVYYSLMTFFNLLLHAITI